LKKLQKLTQSGLSPTDLARELEEFDFDRVIGKASKNSKKVGDFRSQFNKFSSGLNSLQKAFKDPESLKKGLASILGQGGEGTGPELETDTYYYETEEEDPQTEKGTNLVEKLLGMVKGKGGEESDTLTKLKEIMKIVPDKKKKKNKKGKKTKTKTKRVTRRTTTRRPRTTRRLTRTTRKPERITRRSWNGRD
jgi:hypothetical protein